MYTYIIYRYRYKDTSLSVVGKSLESLMINSVRSAPSTCRVMNWSDSAERPISGIWTRTREGGLTLMEDALLTARD